MRITIDTHTHFRRYGEWDCPLEELIALMDAYRIDRAVTGPMECNETGAAGFEEALRRIRPYEGRLRLMLWIHPALSGDADTAEALLRRRGDLIACMKVHPQTARVPLGDPRYEPYLRLCREHDLTLAVHTEPGPYSSADSLAAMAAAHPAVRFIAVHTELRGDHSHAAELIAKHPNLYGDTAFLPVREVRRAIDKCGADKFVFGSDAPILGERYGETLKGLRSVLSPEEAQKLFHSNAVRLFRLGE